MDSIIENIVHEEIERLLNEGLSKNLYHYTSLQRLKQIIGTNSLCLTNVYNSNDNSEMFSKKLFYMCFTREKSCVSGFGYNTMQNVRIEFDGDKLNQNFSGKAINFFKKDGGRHYYMNLKKNIPNIQPKVESEDRLFSDKGVIKNATKYIKRIDIYYKQEYNPEKPVLKDIAGLLNSNIGNRIYIYYNYNDFTYQKDALEQDEVERIKNKYSQEKIEVNKIINKEKYDNNISYLITNILGVFFEYGYYCLKLDIDYNIFFAKILEKYNLNDFVDKVKNYEFKNNIYNSDIWYYLFELQNITIDKEVYANVCRVVRHICNSYNLQTCGNLKAKIDNVKHKKLKTI